jgi:hypothetical protein
VNAPASLPQRVDHPLPRSGLVQLRLCKGWHKRKAWLFSDTQAGARASALLYSLVETAKANNVEPYLWLRHVLRSLPTATTVEHFEALLPWNLNAEQLITA